MSDGPAHLHADSPAHVALIFTVWVDKQDLLFLAFRSNSVIEDLSQKSEFTMNSDKSLSQ